nr:MAG TPA: regulatory protein [Caudoviricetes sp.]
MMNLQKIENFNQFVQVKGNKIITDTLTIARVFGKRHTEVLRAIRNLHLPNEFSQRNFASANYFDKQGKSRLMYEVTKNGFMFLIMGFNGRKADALKVAFIEAFDYIITQANKSSYQLLEEYQQLCLNKRMEEEFASYCGKGLNRWKGKKPNIKQKMKSLEDKIQINLHLMIDENLLTNK